MRRPLQASSPSILTRYVLGEQEKATMTMNYVNRSSSDHDKLLKRLMSKPCPKFFCVLMMEYNLPREPNTMQI